MIRTRQLQFAAFVIGLLFTASLRADVPHTTKTEELKRLDQGNQRFVAGKSEHPRLDSARRGETARQGQKPFATVLSCSDSRAPVEELFDQGVGDLFVIRVAGNIAGISETATIEYGVEHLQTPLLVVMGHKSCGAVAATAQEAKVHGHLPKLLERIQPAVNYVRTKHPSLTGADLVKATVEANVRQSMKDLITGSAIVRQRMEHEQLIVIGAVYDIETGKVEWLGPHPEQSGILGESVGHIAPRKTRVKSTSDGH